MPIPAFGAQPGAKRFLSYFSFILVLLMVLLFLFAMNEIEEDVEKVALQKQVNEINGFLASVIHQYAVLGKLEELSEHDFANPFSIAGKVGNLSNYQGEVESELEVKKEGYWYFVNKSKKLIYHSLHQPTDYKFSLRFRYADLNSDGVYQAGVDRLDRLSIEPE